MFKIMTRQVPLKQPFWTATLELLHDSMISLIQDDGMTTVAHYGDKENALSKVSMKQVKPNTKDILKCG